MFWATDSRHARWHVLHSDDKKRATSLHFTHSESHSAQEGSAQEDQTA